VKTPPSPTRDEVFLRDRLRGDTLKEIGDRHGVSREWVRLVVAKEGRKQIDRLELDLLAGFKSGEHPTFLVGDHAGEAFEIALTYIAWAVGELGKRGLHVAVGYSPTWNGIAIQLRLDHVTPYSEMEQHR
jgi:hypothetical protein